VLRSAIFALLFLFIFEFAYAQTPEAPAGQLVQRVINNEITAQNRDHSHWMFRLSTKKKSEQDVYKVVETKDGNLKLLVLVNGRPAPSNQREQSEARIKHFVRNPADLRKSLKDDHQDTKQSQELLKMLPQAFIFNYAGTRGDLVKMDFKPNPTFHARTHEAEVFHAMEGTLWVDAKQNRLAEINGRLMHTVKFAGGLLGHLDSGGTFVVKQEPVAPGYWELTLLNVHMKGKALFFKTISVQQDYSRSDFQKVPDDLTLAKAADALNKQTSAATR
jgi:hypothetical protein